MTSHPRASSVRRLRLIIPSSFLKGLHKFFMATDDNTSRTLVVCD